MVETRAGMLNSVIANPGIDALYRRVTHMEGLQTNIIANVGGNNIEQYMEGCGKIKRYLCTYDRA